MIKKIFLSLFTTVILIAVSPHAQAQELTTIYWRSATVEGSLLLMSQIDSNEEVAATMLEGALKLLISQDLYAIKFKITNSGTHKKHIKADTFRMQVEEQSYPFVIFVNLLKDGSNAGSIINIEPGASFEGYGFYFCPDAFGGAVNQGGGRLLLP